MTRTRHPALSSRAARQSLGHVSHPAATWIARSIDDLSSLYDGLAAVRAAQNPLHTQEKRALDYKQKFEAAQIRSKEIIDRAVEQMANYQADVEAAARSKAGLDRPVPHASEIRAALRSMTQAERDKAMGDSLAAGDTEPLLACMGANPILTGRFTTPMEVHLKLLMETAAPELVQARADLEAMGNHLSMAASAFRTSTESMRDLNAEERGEQGEQLAADAERKLAAAMAGVATVEQSATVEGFAEQQRLAQAQVRESGSTAL
jgi:hypothetical protein